MTETTSDPWAGQFGADYTRRNMDPTNVCANVALFARILSRVPRLQSVIELGCNVGQNLDAIAMLLPRIGMAGLESNHVAHDMATKDGRAVYFGSATEWKPHQQWDMAFTKGLLIHIPPEHLSTVYDLLYDCARRYVLMAEYYNPQPMGITYRGIENGIWKRDWPGELMARHADLRLLDYGYVSKLDLFRQDDLTWWLFEKMPA